VIPGFATAQGTGRLAGRIADASENGFYRAAQGLLVSSLGIGTYLGDTDPKTDAAYTAAVEAAVRRGINVIDTAINYRHQRSELSIGAALRALAGAGAAARDELVICTKAGFLTPGAIPQEQLHDGDVAGGMHCMTPAFLGDQIERSRRNLGIECIDVFYVHNPESQLRYVDRATFERRLRDAFAELERRVAQGHIRWYGTATWNAYRQKPGSPEALSLPRILEIAREAGGEDHHFRFVQLPVNLAMLEAFTLEHAIDRGGGVSFLEVAVRAGLAVVASASLLQARFSGGLPESFRAKFDGASSDAQAAIQFTRSMPGVTTALVGMSSTAHVEENSGVAGFAPMQLERFLGLFRGGESS